MEKINVLGTLIHNVNMIESIDIFEKYLTTDKINMIFTPNPEMVMMAKENLSYKKIINTGDLVIPDGIGLIYGTLFKKNRIIYRVPGCDLLMNGLNKIKGKKYSIYLLGGNPGVAEKAAKKIEEKFNLNISGIHPGYFTIADENEIVDEINKSQTDILLVGMGMPIQEEFIYRNREKLKVKIAMGVGGSIDILSGKVKRTPKIFRDLGLEWLYRFLKEPKKRFKRILKLPQYMIIMIMGIFKGEYDNSNIYE